MIIVQIKIQHVTPNDSIKSTGRNYIKLYAVKQTANMNHEELMINYSLHASLGTALLLKESANSAEEVNSQIGVTQQPKNHKCTAFNFGCAFLRARKLFPLQINVRYCPCLQSCS